MAGLLARELSLVVLPRRARAIKNINSNSIVAGTFLGQRQPQLDIGSLCLYFSLRLGLLRGLLLHLRRGLLLYLLGRIRTCRSPGPCRLLVCATESASGPSMPLCIGVDRSRPPLDIIFTSVIDLPGVYCVRCTLEACILCGQAEGELAFALALPRHVCASSHRRWGGVFAVLIHAQIRWPLFSLFDYDCVVLHSHSLNSFDFVDPSQEFLGTRA